MEDLSDIKPKTQLGAKWLQEYLHPPSVDRDKCQGIPDHSVQSSATLDWKCSQTIAAPSATGTGTWSCLIFKIPNPHFPALALSWVGNEPANAAAVTTTLIDNANYAFGQDSTSWTGAVARFRAYKSSVTVYFDSSDLYNQGKVWAGQISNTEFEISGSALNGDLQQRNLLTAPAQGAQIMMIDDKYYSGLAKEGVFIPCGFTDPVMNYISANPDPGTINVNFNQVAAPFTLTVTPPSGAWPYVFPGFTVGVALFKGMLNQATLEVKTVDGFECLLTIGSPWTPFTSPGPTPDSGALEAAAIMRHRSPSAFPASANDLGTFLQAGKSLLPILKNVYGAASPLLKAGLRNIGPGGGLAADVLSKVENMMSSRTPVPAPRRAPQQMMQSTQQSVRQSPNTSVGLTKSQKKKRKKKPMGRQTMV